MYERKDHKIFENMIIRLQQTNSKQHFISDILITLFLGRSEREREHRAIKDVAQSMYFLILRHKQMRKSMYTLSASDLINNGGRVAPQKWICIKFGACFN
jgi:hypothetical protein